MKKPHFQHRKLKRLYFGWMDGYNMIVFFEHQFSHQHLSSRIFAWAEICYISSVHFSMALYYTQQRLSIYLLKPLCSSALGINVTLCFLQSSESLMPTVTSDQCEHANGTEAPGEPQWPRLTNTQRSFPSSLMQTRLQEQSHRLIPAYAKKLILYCT